MAIFNKSDKRKAHATNTTIIAGGTKVHGEIDIECKIHVDGIFAGSIRSDNIISIGTTGEVEGDILAQKLVVNGRFKGSANCDEIEILSGGRVVGHIISKVLVIERGSFFEGESLLKDSKEGEDKKPPAPPLANEQSRTPPQANKPAVPAQAAARVMTPQPALKT